LKGFELCALIGGRYPHVKSKRWIKKLHGIFFFTTIRFLQKPFSPSKPIKQGECHNNLS
jgi:hypothetical protein